MNDDPKETIAKLIKEARLKKGYSQQQLASLTQLNLRSVQRIEKGQVWPRAYNLNLLVQQLDLDTAYIGALRKPLVNDLTAQLPQQLKKKPLQPKKVIFSIALILLTILLAAAFLSQSAKFPETNFELFLFLASLVGCNALVLWLIWK